MGVDYFEFSLAVTKDLRLVCSQTIGLRNSTNIDDHLEFRSRKDTRYIMDTSETITDFFIDDFTLKEVK